jgi:hypothetical protein
MEVLSNPLRQDEETLKPWIDPHQLKQHQGVWYKDGHTVITGNIQDKREVICVYHDSPVYSHPGISKTVQLTKRNHWWPGMKHDIAEYVRGCADCQRHKVNNRPTRAPLQPIYPKAKAMPFETVTLDFIVKLPVSQGFNSILTVTDQGCTKAAIFIPCNEDITAEEMAALYIKHVFSHFSLPTKVISDRDPWFMSKFMQAACKVTGVKHAPSTAYHPRTDGQSECSNQWLETAIHFITDEKQKNWAPYLPIAQFAHNNWPSDTTRKSPLFSLMGFNPRADWIHATSPIPRVTLRLEQLKEARDQARNFMIKAQQSWVKHRDTPKYKEGDLVWLEGKNLCINQPTAKLAPRRHGPFKIIQVMSTVNYRLELPTQWSIHPVFHIDLLTPYKETTMHGPNFTQPAPELIDGEEEYSMEKILDSQRFGRRWRLQYLVKWEGYPNLDNMWVDKDDVSADNKIRDFKTLNPESEVHLRWAHVVSIPYSPIPISHTLHSSLILQHSMSSDADSTLPYEYPTGAYGDNSLGLGSDTAADIANAFHRMSIHTPARLSPNGAAVQAEEVVYVVSFPDEAVIRDAHRFSLASGAALGGASETGVTQLQQTQQGDDPCPVTSDDDDDLSICPLCTSEQAYCHCQPNPVTMSPPPLPIPPRPTSPRHMGQIELNREQAEALVARLAASLDAHHENPAEIQGEREPPPEYPAGSRGVEPELTVQGVEVLDIPVGGCQNQGRRRPVPVHNPGPGTDPRPTPANERARRNPLSPSSQGYELNRGVNYISCNILDRFGREVPAQFIKPHLNIDNPYVEAHLEMGGLVYHGEIHATPVNDRDDAHPELTNESLHMLEPGYRDRSAVEDALGSVGDRSLGAKVTRWNALKKKIKHMQDQIQEREDQMFTLSVAQRACHKRLEEARVISKLQEEMRRDRQVYPLMLWSVKRGCST